jgi:ATP-binding cassette, subfamily B, bacterial
MFLKTPKISVKEADHFVIPKTPLGFLFFAAKQNVFLGFFAVACVTFAQLSGVFMPFALKKIIDLASTENSITENISLWVFLFPALMFTMFLFYRLSGFIGMIWLTRTESFAYKVLFNHLSQHSHAYFSNRFAGSITNKISHASEGVFRLLDGTLWGHYGAVLSLLASGILIFRTNFWVGCVYVVLITILIPTNYYLARNRKPHVVKFAAQKTAMKGKAVDIITNVAAMRQFSQQKMEGKNIADAIEKYRIADIKQWRLSEWSLTFNNIVIVTAVSIMLFIMYQLWLVHAVSSGDFVLVLTLIMSLSSTLVFIGSAMNQFIRVYGDVEEGLDEILLPYEIVDRSDAKSLVVNSGEITWSDVTFKYNENSVFDHFNLTIHGGQRIGLVGSSGAGKTTFVSLLLRQHELSGGAITIDGQNIADVTQDSLREQIAVVPQEPMLFHRSIRENIVYGKPDATEEEVIAVAKKAQAHDFITELAEGYDTLVGERGVKLSGGQKQRIAIARAMLKNAPILILDEATSALDSESEVAIQKALHELMDGKTVVAIAHRLSTLREMDRIIVLEKGKIVEDGTHAKLTKKKHGIYARLWEHQAGGFLIE